ncbi:MAG: DUF4251 domain-containing protein, partial [Alistipes sp.]|nr:DUF4251 domain-containing protein [Candidatus Minthomonas equi]
DADAQTADKGGISQQMLDEIRKGWSGTPEEKALRNAVTHTGINTIALNNENEAYRDTHFSDEVRTKGISNQKSSGRCWLFSGLNVLRSKFIEDQNTGKFQFSQNYCFFWDQLEKANLFLESIIETAHLPMDDRRVEWLFKNAIGDGGQFTGVADLIMKYGVVPAEVFPETNSSNNTSQMRMLLAWKLKEFGLELRRIGGIAFVEANKDANKAKREKINAELQARKVEMLQTVYRFLVMNLGEPPVEFDWTLYDAAGNPVSTKHYTPLSFYEEYLNIDLKNNYVLFMNDPTRAYYKTYEIDMDRHTYDGENWLYVNLPIEEIEQMAIASIKGGDPMYFSCDVGKFLDREKGFLDVNYFDYSSLMGSPFGMSKEERILTGASGSSHAMTLCAVDLNENGRPRKWKVENSWGMTGNDGYLIMTEEWFREYMFRLVVDKKYVPAGTLELLKQKPILLPPWDPMFDEDDSEPFAPEKTEGKVPDMNIRINQVISSSPMAPRINEIYEMNIKDGQMNTFLPFIGTSDNVGYGEDPSIQINCPLEKISVKDKGKKVEYRFECVDSNNLRWNVYLTVFEGESISARFNSSSRSPMTYNGTIVKE